MGTLPPNRNLAFAGALLAELVRAGLRDVGISPGSRSAPLAIAAAQQDGLQRSVHIDERSGAFHALGLARASRRPVALICTSGTAAANFYPAVIEAHYARVPLLVLSADRPPELRDWGAGQTIDQVRLYGSHVRWFAEAPTPETSLLRYARALAGRAFAVAQGPPAGPVHLNLPFREPLDPQIVPGDCSEELARTDPLGAEGRAAKTYVEVSRATRSPDPQDLETLLDCVREHPRGVVLCGPMDAEAEFGERVSALARAAGWPLLVDGVSSLRGGPHAKDAPLVSSADLLVRDPAFAAEHAPSCVLHFGDTPTSKALRGWLDAKPPAEFLRVDPDGSWHDPTHLASRVICADPARVCRSLTAALSPAQRDSTWLRAFLSAEARAAAALSRLIEAESELLEPQLVRDMAAVLPEDALLYVSNSMPVRDLDAFLPTSARRLRVLSNRGAAGIDGMVSSALGAAAAGVGNVTLLVGDVALAHDLSGLFAAQRLGISLRVVVIDNGGGGIFSFLPIAGYGKRVEFDELFLTPPALDIEATARAAGARYTRITTRAQLRGCLEESADAPGLEVLHVPVDRERNVSAFRTLVAEVGAAWREDEG